MSVSRDAMSNATREDHVRTISLLQPLNWLSRGWQDIRQQPGPSIAYGLLVTGLGFVILVFTTMHVYFMAAAISGFLLVGPIMATGLCELSRRHARREPVSFDDSLDALGRHSSSLTHFAAILFGLSIIWFLVSGLLLETFFGSAAPAVSETVWGEFAYKLTMSQTMVYLAAGGILAVIVFVLSVVAVPAILDRDASASEAMRVSARAVVANIPAMIIWAALIVALTALGFITFLLGMIVIYPLLGHATWYAYEDLVGAP